MISSERRIQLIERLVDPPGNAKPDFEIVKLIAHALGNESEFQFQNSEQVFEEWKVFTKGTFCDMNGITYERLRRESGIQLPCPEIDHPGTERLFADRNFPRADGKAALLSREYHEAAETADSEYPYILITGREASHFNTATRTGRIAEVTAAGPENIVEIHPNDAKHLGLEEGDEAVVTSRRGAVTAVVRKRDRILEGTIYMNAHYGPALSGRADRLANLATNNVYDVHSKQPEFKISAVKIEIAEYTT